MERGELLLPDLALSGMGASGGSAELRRREVFQDPQGMEGLGRGSRTAPTLPLPGKGMQKKG